MYLSSVEIDMKNRSAAADLANDRCVHGWIESCFPMEMENHIRTRKLWRIDTVGKKKKLLILSETKPYLPMLQKYGVKGTAMTRSYEPLLDSLKEGQRCAFRMELNPFSKSSGKVKDADHYFLERTKQLGIRIDPTWYSSKTENRPVKKNGRMFDVIHATYNGIMTITDVEALKKVLVTGCGHEKAYGCGMISVQPLEAV